ncbi:hypothetical protein [Salirhabdus salicampi]|uniref:hypothetical protein n=1 Tax=Salirhabdus salicampi TaxID=476102 RepID=UPI0020C2E9D4|nr:hypothetical protein [Salirhabdus salicampi]MCP8615365.1 hypothetical protein [Salirhabdus salicampi]
MKSKILILVLFLTLIITACGQKATIDDPITLLNQDQEEVTFPLEKPTLFFFITTYT